MTALATPHQARPRLAIHRPASIGWSDALASSSTLREGAARWPDTSTASVGRIPIGLSPLHTTTDGWAYQILKERGRLALCFLSFTT